MSWFKLIWNKDSPIELRRITQPEVMNNVLQNNQSGNAIQSLIDPLVLFLVECENQPNDIPSRGLHWEKVEEE